MAGMQRDLAQHITEYQKCNDEQKNATIITIEDKKSAEVSLLAYSSYAVSDNFMYDDNDNNNSNWRMRRNPSLREGKDQTLAEKDAELD
jgi:type II secretory pathway component PulJ